MLHTRKLKPDRSISGAIYPFSIILLFGLSSLIFGFSVGLFVVAAVYGLHAIYSLYIFLRMGNFGHLVISFSQIYIGTLIFLMARHYVGWDLVRIEWMIAWITGVVFFTAVSIYLVVTKKIKWRGREIFELAAGTVEETGNGYTPRPRPVGRVEFTKQELVRFARFCASHLMAAVYINPKQITFVPVRMGEEYSSMFRSERAQLETSWISFDFEGEVSVHIAQKDYLDYQEPLSFDKLCESLGRLFITWAILHQRGEGVRIIDQLDGARLGYFS